MLMFLFQKPHLSDKLYSFLVIQLSSKSRSFTHLYMCVYIWTYIFIVMSDFATNIKQIWEIAQFTLQLMLYRQPSFLSFLIFETKINSRQVTHCFRIGCCRSGKGREGKKKGGKRDKERGRKKWNVELDHAWQKLDLINNKSKI